MSAPQKPSPLDWLSFPSPAVVEAPHPDLFESELDNTLSTFDQGQLQLLTLDLNDSFAFFRTESNTQGPPSVLTVSSESAYETLSSYSESFYNFPNSPAYPPVDAQYNVDLAVDFAKFTVDTDADGLNMPTMDPVSDSAAYASIASSFERPQPAYETSNSYELSAAGGKDGSLFPSAHHGYNTVSPANISASGRYAPTASPLSSSDGSLMRTPDPDPRKKYPCPNCTRSFARAYNLKTHLATHDPNRLKPYVCHHRSCGRSFSRKHDLGRHLVSIHRDESAGSAGSVHSDPGLPRNLSDKPAARWCEDCGRSWIGRQRACDCVHDVK